MNDTEKDDVVKQQEKYEKDGKLNSSSISISSSSSSSSCLYGMILTYGLSCINYIRTECHILVIGSGGIGCELLKNLALCGFTHVEVIDLDTIDISNLNRQLLFRQQHVGQPKCHVACNVASKLVPTTTTTTKLTQLPHDDDDDDNSSSTNQIRYIPHHGNVCNVLGTNTANGNGNKDDNVGSSSTCFDVAFFKRFDVVLNALDNVIARRHVNRMCLASNVPLIESGTTGYIGQVTVIHRNSSTSCYECTTHEPPKQYPICTIRSTPSMPVHTIVWAKELYKLLFHTNIQESMLYEGGGNDNGNGSDNNNNNNNNDNNKKKEKRDHDDDKDDDDDDNQGGFNEPSTFMPTIFEFRQYLDQQEEEQQEEEEKAVVDPQKSTTTTTTTTTTMNMMIIEFTRRIVTTLYIDEIQKQLDMNRYKTAKKRPIVLDHNIIEKALVGQVVTTASTESSSLHGSTNDDDDDTTKPWSQEKCITVIASCLQQAYEIRQRQQKQEKNGVENGNHDSISTTPVPSSSSSLLLLEEFDKDDELCIRFVTATSNLRNYVFYIEPIQSLHDTKGIAGNIIPAIATTNAIIAGIQVIQTFHILAAIQQQKQQQQQENNKKKKKAGDDHDVKQQQEEEEEEEDDNNNNNSLRLKDYCSYVNCNRNPTRNGLYLTATSLEGPNPDCYICQKSTTVTLTLDVYRYTLSEFIQRIIKKDLGFQYPTIMIDDTDCVVWEEGDDADIDNYISNLNKTLHNLPQGGIKHGTTITIEDFTQDLSVQIYIVQQDHHHHNNNNKEKEKGSDSDNNNMKTNKNKKQDNDEDEDDGLKYTISGQRPTKTTTTATANSSSSSNDNDESKPAVVAMAANQNNDNDDDDDDDFAIMIVKNPDDKNSNNNSKKRSAAETNDTTTTASSSSSDQQQQPSKKKSKMNNDPQDGTTAAAAHQSMDIIEIDDD